MTFAEVPLPSRRFEAIVGRLVNEYFPFAYLGYRNSQFLPFDGANRKPSRLGKVGAGSRDP